ncbi:uncharacterized protein F4812DRAFT_308505 [Daldinia caldariorum]|uniref:uncharacterized protein n=1 Tax=Daldinia caldariorum TaxID=326644 RepID=UPI00200881EF|nr:uncharacterized protein F4812DRAFT_308505 [Daldinia caldariorum]KAI1469966.1 hypothetical protein F4812DRAFT_308505 [Daldinia caldariorum]
MASASSAEHSRMLGGYASKSNIGIHIKNHYRSRVYTTGSEVSGEVIITPQTSTRFDILQIVLLGTSKTCTDAVNIPQTTAHTFLKLAMPIPESSYPIPRVFEAGLTYTIPFTFVIPSTLTLNACSHHVANNSVQEHHTRLPPTMGSWEKDDFAPQMSRVQYAIKARVYTDDGTDGSNTKIMEATEEIKVLPTTPEDAPLSITKQDDLYVMSKSKTLRRSIISPKTGKLTITAAQPSAAMLIPDGKTITSTIVPLHLEFEPIPIDTRPPRVTGITSKVTAVTYFSAGGMSHYPNLKNGYRSFGSDSRGSYSNTVSITTGPFGEVKWSHHLRAQSRRSSGYGSDSPSSDTDLPSTPTSKKATSNLSSPIFHSAQLQVPIQLPVQKRTFVPTFHSCITSRVYVLWLTITVGSGGNSANLTLGVPLQIGVSGANLHPADAALPPSFEETEEADIEEYLRPRVMRIPTVDFHHNEAPPGYADMHYNGQRTVAAH